LAFGRQTLSLALAPFFIIGLWRSIIQWKAGGRDEGDSSCLDPRNIHGVNRRTELKNPLRSLSPRHLAYRRRSHYVFARRIQWAIVPIVLLVSTLEAYNLFDRIPRKDIFYYDGIGPKVRAEKALAYSPRFDQVFVSGPGKDVISLVTRKNRNIHFVFFEDWEKEPVQKMFGAAARLRLLMSTRPYRTPNIFDVC